jgi:flagellar hook-associated protein 3 FlgL
MAHIPSGNRLTADIARQARLAADIAQTQTQIASGARLQTAADDPLAAARIAQIDRARSDDASWGRNLALGTALAAQADGVLASVNERMGAARERMLQGASGTTNASDRATLAQALRSLADDIDQLAATRSALGTPLFQETAMRIDTDVVLAPVGSHDAIFAPGGTALSDDVRVAAAALDAGDATAIAAALTRLDRAAAHSADAHAEQGLRAARFDRLADAQAARGIDRAVERSALADTNLTDAIARLNAKQLTLEAAQAAFARLNRQTLFDLIR